MIMIRNTLQCRNGSDRNCLTVLAYARNAVACSHRQSSIATADGNSLTGLLGEPMD